MKRSILAALAAPAVASCFVGTLDLSGLPCPCLQGYVCVNGACEPGDGGTVITGSCPVCTPGGEVQLCDGGVLSCGSGDACDYGACGPSCPDGGDCPAGTVCDLTPHVCVPTDACSEADPCDSSLVVCLDGVCAPVPEGDATDCSAPTDGGSSDSPITVSGIVATFPDAIADDSTGLQNGTVTFLSSDTSVSSVATNIFLSGQGITSFTAALVPGTWTALVQAPGAVLPTYFPNLVVQQPPSGSTIQLDLWEVVPVSLDAGTEAGHVVWVGRASGCGEGYLAGYTVGLSPPARALEYYVVPPAGGYQLDPTLQASSDAGAFIAEDAPFAVTDYVMALASPGHAPEALLSGTFVPPTAAPLAGETIAIALVYPNTFP